MRVRLLIDVEVPEPEVMDLAELITEQPSVEVSVLEARAERYLGRLMGATPVGT